ncbi:MAG TPA: SH3 domain-containing protein [Ramlibacter sp.]|nr:SH3 domain-containing protein [Ramlibacter sp.]
MKHAVLGAIAVSMAALCASAQAQAPVQVIAYTSRSVNLRAGPARDYPVVAVLPGGFQVAVQGCLSDYTWCDVIAGYDRGWVYAGNINYPYQNQWQPLLTWGPVIGIGILPFVFDDYWPRYYWNRPWYRDRDRWAHLHPHDGRRRPPQARPPAGSYGPGGQPYGPPGTRPYVPRGEHPRGPQGERHRPEGGSRQPGQVAPGQAVPGARPVPPRPPGWRPQPRLGPVPQPAQRSQPAPVPAAPRPAPPRQPAPAQAPPRQPAPAQAAPRPAAPRHPAARQPEPRRERGPQNP